MTDTIFAVSSGAAPSAIAVLRVSGPAAFDALAALAGDLPPSRRATLRTLRDADGAVLDRAVVIGFPGPGSATGEDVAELHLHGGRATIAAVSAALAALPGLRAAEPGEFTRRALANARIDLTAAEGLADLLAAETEAQRRTALRAAEGGLRRLIEGWTTRAVEIAAMLEATIDHDEDVGDNFMILAHMRDGAAMLADEIAGVIARPPAERLRDGIRVVFAGPPNSGKSSLFNAMAGRDAAIVSPLAGTTRDRIEAPVVRDGIAWLLIDTAGLRDDPADAVEAIGVDRARAAVDGADLVLWLGDEPPPMDGMIAVHARADLPDRGASVGRIAASAATIDGAEGVWHALSLRAAELLPGIADLALNVRQRDLCCNAEVALRAAASEVEPLFIADHLRRVLSLFDSLTGRANTESMLDALFSRFCLGK